MKEWFTAKELMEAHLPDLPTSERSLYRFIEKQG